MAEVASIRLDVSRVGQRLIFRVSSLDGAGAELGHVGWIVAHDLNDTPMAIDEAKDAASEECRTHGFKTYTMYDHRVHPNDYIANAASRIDPRQSEHSIQFRDTALAVNGPGRLEMANDNASVAAGGAGLTDFSVLSAILRIGTTSMTKEALEAALGKEIERYEPTRVGGSMYAQVHIPIEGDFWPMLVDWIKVVGPRLLALRNDRLVGSTCIDVGVLFPDSQASLTVRVPSVAATTIGSCGLDIEFAVYLVGG